MRNRYFWPSVLMAAVGLGLPTLGMCQFQGAGTLVGAPTPDQDALGARDASDLKRSRPRDEAKAAPAPKPEDRVKLGILAAQDLLKAQKYPETLAKLREVDAIGGKTPFEAYLVERTRLAAAAQANNQPLVLQSLAAVLETGQAPPDEELKFSDQLARNAFNQKDYAKTIAWASRYFKAGGNDADMRRSLLFAYYLSNDYARVAQEVSSDIQADEKAGKAPAEYQLRLLYSSAQKLGDKPAYDSAVAKYTSYYPKTK